MNIFFYIFIVHVTFILLLCSSFFLFATHLLISVFSFTFKFIYIEFYNLKFYLNDTVQKTRQKVSANVNVFLRLPLGSLVAKNLPCLISLRVRNSILCIVLVLLFTDTFFYFFLALATLIRDFAVHDFSVV